MLARRGENVEKDGEEGDEEGDEESEAFAGRKQRVQVAGTRDLEVVSTEHEKPMAKHKKTLALELMALAEEVEDIGGEFAVMAVGAILFVFAFLLLGFTLLAGGFLGSLLFYLTFCTDNSSDTEDDETKMMSRVASSNTEPESSSDTEPESSSDDDSSDGGGSDGVYSVEGATDHRGDVPNQRQLSRR